MRHTLSVDDYKAFKTADRLAFHLAADGARITAIKESGGRLSGPFISGRRRAEHEITANHGTTERAFFLVYAWHGQNGTLAALRALVKAGDELHVYARANNNQYMDEAGLFSDELLVTVLRPNGENTAKVILHEFVLAHSQCPNNSARAIQCA